MPVPCQKLKFAKSLIQLGEIKTVEQLYNLLSKKVVADILGLNSNSFSNKKSNNPGEFRLAQLISIASTLDVDLNFVITIFTNSIL